MEKRLSKVGKFCAYSLSYSTLVTVTPSVHVWNRVKSTLHQLRAIAIRAIQAIQAVRFE